MTIKLAVLGANGFIGSRLVEQLYLTGLAEVTPIVRTWASSARLARFDLETRIANAFDPIALRQAFANCDVVVHTIAGDQRTILDTLTSTYQAAHAAGVRRLVYLSSASVHGQSPPPQTTEASPLDARQTLEYNNSKVQAEWKLQALRSKGTTEIVILRPAIVTGPRSFWVADFVEKLLSAQACWLDKGSGICNSIYIDNLVHAIFLAATAPHVDRQAYFVGDAEQVTWADFYQPIATTLGFDLGQIAEARISHSNINSSSRLHRLRMSTAVQSFLSYFPMNWRQAAYLALSKPRSIEQNSAWTMPTINQPGLTEEMALLYQCRTRLSFEKAKKELEYAPLVSFEEGSKRTVAWLRFAGYPVVASL